RYSLGGALRHRAGDALAGDGRALHAGASGLTDGTSTATSLWITACARAYLPLVDEPSLKTIGRRGLTWPLLQAVKSPRGRTGVGDAASTHTLSEGGRVWLGDSLD